MTYRVALVHNFAAFAAKRHENSLKTPKTPKGNSALSKIAFRQTQDYAGHLHNLRIPIAGSCKQRRLVVLIGTINVYSGVLQQHEHHRHIASVSRQPQHRVVTIVTLVEEGWIVL